MCVIDVGILIVDGLNVMNCVDVDISSLSFCYIFTISAQICN